MLVYKQGYGLLNSAINSLPFELHIPGYQYCGPGTKLEKRLARGDLGINPLDAACRVHDIAYSKHRDGPERTKADRALSSAAWNRVVSKDAGIGERTAALAVAAAMKAKIGAAKLGRGIISTVRNKKKKTEKRNNKKRASSKAANGKKKCRSTKKKCCSFKSLVSDTWKKTKSAKPKTSDDIVRAAISAAEEIALENSGGVSRQPRIIPIPKTGGVLPLVPIFAGLSALGSLAGGASAVYNALRSTKENRDSGANMGKRGVEIGKSARGDGVFLRPYKKGYGIYVDKPSAVVKSKSKN